MVDGHPHSLSHPRGTLLGKAIGSGGGVHSPRLSQPQLPRNQTDHERGVEMDAERSVEDRLAALEQQIATSMRREDQLLLLLGVVADALSAGTSRITAERLTAPSNASSTTP